MAARELVPVGPRPSPLRLSGAPVLLYHGLTIGPDTSAPLQKKKYVLPATQFRNQLHWIRQDGYRIACLREVWNQPSPARNAEPTVVLTFDDGRASDYELACPLLCESSARAEFFLNTATIGTPGSLTWPQVAEMQRAGMSFQSHSHDHVALPLLPALELVRQLRKSRQILEDRLGCPVDFLAVPYGLLNHRVVDFAMEAGYCAVCDSWSWPARPAARTVHRVAVYRHTTPRHFRQLLRKDPIGYATQAARTALLYVPKQILARYWPRQLGVRVLEAHT